MSNVRDAFLGSLGYPPDGFQLRAMDSLDADASVLVAAPTGSGKTLIAEYAIARARSAGLRAFYTAPIKALSNQKYRDLCGVHGPGNVGLVTGDNAVNADAPIVVMTTEVLRNMIYASSDRLDSLGVVVLDEVHFLQDAYRGPVWEEVIIQLDPTVQLVCLSATVSNADEVGEWLSTVRGRTDVVVETNRPVELLTHHAFYDASTGRVVMHDAIINGEPNRGLERTLATGKGTPGNKDPRRSRRRFATPTRPETVDLLDEHDMLPAIVFIFSRAQCEDAAASCAKSGIVLTSREEEDRIIEIVEAHVESLSNSDRRALGYDDFLDQIGSGVACHHAGMIPMFKEAVEQCFQEGLVKVVFATETLAVGINMPARAVVIEKLTKYTGEHHVLLRASEYTQLTGRAGRRGLDRIGHAVTLWNPWVTFDQTVGLALSRSFRLTSAFRPTFNMAVNMVRRHSREAATHFLNLSFAQFQADRDIVTSEAVLERKRRELARLEMSSEELQEAFANDDPETVASDVEAEIALRSLRPGDVVVFDSANIRGRGLVISTASRRGGTRLTVLTPSRKQVEVTSRDLLSVPVRSASIDLPVPFEPARVEFVREAVARLVRARVDESVRTPSLTRSSRPQREVVDSARSLRRLRREIEQLSERSANRAGSVSKRFEDVADLLGELGYLDGWSLTDRGELLAGVFHESDLLVAEVIMSGVLDRLSTGDLVACVSSLVFEPRGGDSGHVRWPNDTVRNRVKRIEKISSRLQEAERARGLQMHRNPHAGLALDALNWANGKPLSEVLDPELTPGDFVRSMRQMIDLLRQIEKVAPSPELRASAVDAVDRINRGVVAAAAGESA